MTKINKTHKLKEYSMLIMDSVKKWSTPFYLVNKIYLIHNQKQVGKNVRFRLDICKIRLSV